MKKDLESWLRGETPQGSDAPASPPAADKQASAAGLRLPVAALITEPEERPQTADTAYAAPADAVPDDALNEAAEESAESAIVDESTIPEALPVAEEAAEEAEPSDRESGGEKIGERIFVPVENFPQDESENTSEAAETDSQPENYGVKEEHDGKDYHTNNVKSPAAESPEEARARIEARLRQMKDMQRAAYMYEQGDDFLKNRRRRVIALCVLAVAVIGAAALYFGLRRDSYGSMMDKALELYEQEQYAASFEAYSEASVEYRDRAEPLLGMGRAAGRIGRVDDALAAYGSCLERLSAAAPRFRSSVFCEIGNLHTDLKAWGNAQKSFEEAVTADASNYGAYFALGSSLEEQARLDEALLAYRQALNLSPSSDAAVEAVSRVSFALSDEGEADEKNDTGAEQRYGQAFSSGGIALKDARYAEASKYFAEALAIRSDDADAWVGFAEARDKLGDRAGAVKSFGRALERDPEHELAKSRLADIEAQKKKNTTRTNPPRKKSSSSQQSASLPSSAKSTTEKTQAAVTRKGLFDAGVELYRNGEYEKAFDSFTACMRSGGRDALPPLGLAGEPGPVWKGTQAKLNVPPNARLLAESVRLNPADRNLYVNLSMAASQMPLNRQIINSAMSEVRSHALMMASNR